MSYVVMTPATIFSIQYLLDTVFANLSVKLASSIDRGSCDDEVYRDIEEIQAIKHYFGQIDINSFDVAEAELLWERAAEIGGLTYTDVVNNWNVITQCN